MRVKDMRLACPFCGGFFTVEMGEDKRFWLYHRVVPDGVVCPVAKTRGCIGDWTYPTRIMAEDAVRQRIMPPLKKELIPARRREMRARFDDRDLAEKIVLGACIPRVSVDAALMRLRGNSFQIVAHVPTEGNTNRQVTFTLEGIGHWKICSLSPRMLEQVLKESGLDGDEICYRLG